MRRRGTPRRVDDEVLFWRNVAMIPFHECWEWVSRATSRGPSGGKYGVVGSGRSHAKPVMAHRFSWELHNGPIPEGMLVLHRCDNPSCVNPAHLFLGTYQDNVRDMIAKGRQVVPSKLTTEQVLEARRRVAAGETHRSVAVAFGVHRSTITAAISGKNWRKVELATVPAELLGR